MARPRKPRRKAPAAKDEKQASPEQPAETRCWLCSEPLTGGVLAPLLGIGPFEVHQKCYEQALKS